MVIELITVYDLWGNVNFLAKYLRELISFFLYFLKTHQKINEVTPIMRMASNEKNPLIDICEKFVILCS